MSTILVADGQPEERRRTAAALRLAGYGVAVVRSANEAGPVIRRTRPAAVVVDPAGDEPSDVIRQLRLRTKAPIIVLSQTNGTDGADTEVSLLDAGADDYLTKPVGLEQFLARLRAVLRRAAGPEPRRTVVTTADFSVDLEERRWVRADGHQVLLTPTEWRLVEVLVEREGHLVTHSELVERISGPRAEGSKQYLRVYLASLRHKVEPEPADPRYFLTIAGFGLRFDRSGGSRS